MAEHCRNCRFSKSYGNRLACRRYPPAVGPDRFSDAEFPFVHPIEWCGEWLAMRPGAGLPAAIAPSPRSGGATVAADPGSRRHVVTQKPEPSR